MSPSFFLKCFTKTSSSPDCPLHLACVCWFGSSMVTQEILVFFCFWFIFFVFVFCNAKCEKKKTSAEHEWMKEKQQWVSREDKAWWMPLHTIMLLIWCVTRWCTANNYPSSASLCFQTLYDQAHTYTNKCPATPAVPQDHRQDHTPTCWTQSREKMD